jgi:hypothetical protein
MQNIAMNLTTRKIIYLVAILSLASSILVACLGNIACSSTQAPTEKEQTTMDILKNAIGYIKTKHPDAAVFMNDNISFAESSSEKHQQGYTGITYTGGGWIIIIGHAITPETVYEIRAEYNNGNITWIGVSKNGQIKEDSYTKSK